jgi:hypothetical protein
LFLVLELDIQIFSERQNKVSEMSGIIKTDGHFSSSDLKNDKWIDSTGENKKFHKIVAATIQLDHGPWTGTQKLTLSFDMNGDGAKIANLKKSSIANQQLGNSKIQTRDGFTTLPDVTRSSHDNHKPNSIEKEIVRSMTPLINGSTN